MAATSRRSARFQLAWLGAAIAGVTVAAFAWMAVPATPPLPLPSATSGVVADVAVPFGASTCSDETPSARGAERVAGEASRARLVRVRVTRRIGGLRQHYVGALRLVGEANGDRELQLDSNAPIDLQVLPGVPVQFSAPAYAPVVWMPPEGGDPDATHDVTLAPASALRFHWSPAPDRVPERVAVELRTQQHFVSVPREGSAAAARTIEIAFPGGGEDIAWSLTTTQGASLVRATGTVTGLGLAEVRDVVVDLGAVAMQQHVLVGPSSALLPHLIVRWVADSGRVDTVPVAADGAFQRPVAETAEVFVSTLGAGASTTRAVDAAAVVRCVLQQPLVGVQLLADDGTPMTSKVVDAKGRTIGFAGTTHVWPRRELPAQLTLHDGNERLTFATSALAEGVDLLTFRRCDARPTADIVVTVEGTAPAEELEKVLSLLARSDEPRSEQSQQPCATTRFALPNSGRYRVRWRCGALDGPEVGCVTVQPGQRVELTTNWPALQEWTGEVLGFGELSVRQRWHRVGFGAGESILSGWPLRLDAKGRFRGVRFAGDAPAEPVFLAWGLCRVEAAIAERDDERRHLVVRPSTALRWVDVVVEAPAPWQVHVMRSVPGSWPRFVHVIANDQRWPIPVAGDDPLLLSLVRHEESTLRVLAWATSSGLDPVVRLRPAPTRRLMVRTSSGQPRRISFVGPAGQVDGQHEVRTDAPLRVDVPFDTRGVVTWPDDASTAWREIAIGGSDVVVID